TRQVQMYRARALTGSGTLAIWLGDYPAAPAIFEETLSLPRELCGRGDIAKALSNLGVILTMQHEYATARSVYEESLAIRRELGGSLANKSSMAALLNNLAD